MRARSVFLGLALLAVALLLATPRTQADPKEAKAKNPGKEAGKALKLGEDLTEELTTDDPKDTVRTGMYAKAHTIDLKAGKAYRIDMVTRETPQKLDPYLRLEDPSGRQVAQDDDGGGYPNARILYQAEKDGKYKIICTTFAPNQTGKFSLTVEEASAADQLRARAQKISAAPRDEQKKIVAEVEKYFRDHKDKLTPQDGQLAMQIGSALEQRGSNGLAAEAYTGLGKALAATDDKRVADFGRMLEGAGRRVNLPGHLIEVKGKTLDGMELNWKSYRGKVVLVDFWASWCGPCVAEVPNIKKLYEKYHDRGFDVVGISLDQNAEAPRKFMKDRELPWQCIAPDGGAQDLSKYYGILFIPMPILVDRKGNVISMTARGPELARLLEQHVGQAEKGEKKKSDE